MSCDNPKLGIVNNNMYAKYDPNPSILSQDAETNFGHKSRAPNSAEMNLRFICKQYAHLHTMT